MSLGDRVKKVIGYIDILYILFEIEFLKSQDYALK